MGASKADCFNREQNEMAMLFKVLANPARVAILEYLLSVDSCICGDIVNELPLAQSTISLHLKELKQAGFIKGSVEGTTICYCVNPIVITKLRSYFMQMHDVLAGKCC